MRRAVGLTEGAIEEAAGGQTWLPPVSGSLHFCPEAQALAAEWPVRSIPRVL